MPSSKSERLLAIGLTVLLVGVFGLAGGIQAATVYVDDDNISGPWDGSAAHPYKEIKGGIDNADSGDTVYVFHGTYAENINVGKAIHLTGETKDSTIIDGGGWWHVITVYGDSVTISNFTIQHSGGGNIGVRVRWPTNTINHVTISDNIIRENGGGIYLDATYQECSCNSISSNLIMDNSIYGIKLDNFCDSNVISNNTIIGNSYGIHLYNTCNHNTIFGNNVTHNEGNGIELGGFGGGHCNNNTISEDTISANTDWAVLIDNASTGNAITGSYVSDGGIRIEQFCDSTTISGNTLVDARISVYRSCDNIISGDTITFNGVGLSLDRTCGNTIADNDLKSTALGVQTGINLTGDSPSNWNSHAMENNTLNGVPIRYYKDTSDVVVPGDAAQVILANCSGFTVQGFDFQNIFRPIQVAFSSSNTISGNSVFNSWHGMYLIGSDTNTVIGNRIDSCTVGIYLENSAKNEITGDTTLNSDQGIYLTDSDSNEVANNYTAGNHDGIYLISSDSNTIQGNTVTENTNAGLHIVNSNYNYISENSIAKNGEEGIDLSGSGNRLDQNDITGNNRGIYLGSSSDNTVYHNMLIDNSQNAYDRGVNNQWDDGYPAGGNYWSDYLGMDADGDGFGDSPYDVPGDSGQDQYPFMLPWEDMVVFVDDDAEPGWYDSAHVSAIQEGIDSAAYGGMVYVHSGTYPERLTIVKRVDLIGQHFDSVVVDGGGAGDVISILADSVKIRGFTVQNAGAYAGIVISSNHNAVRSSKVTNTEWGIYLKEEAANNSISANQVSGNQYGFYVAGSSFSNTISDHEITNNQYGVYIISSSDSNRIYHNNFLDNTQSAYDECDNQWDDGYPSSGNYWSDFDEPAEGAFDNDGDGLVDSAYLVPGGSSRDRYPFIDPWDGTGPVIYCSDANNDEVIDLVDVVYLINYVFKGDPEPRPGLCVGDASGDGGTSITDVVYLIGYIFKNGPPPSTQCCGQSE